MLLLVRSTAGVIGFVVLFGAGFGAVTPARAALVAEFYGPANYGSIKSAMRAIAAHPDLHLQLVVGASALLDRFGSVIDVIEADGFTADAKVAMIVEGETPATMAKSTGLGLIELPDVQRRADVAAGHDALINLADELAGHQRRDLLDEVVRRVGKIDNGKVKDVAVLVQPHEVADRADVDVREAEVDREVDTVVGGQRNGRGAAVVIGGRGTLAGQRRDITGH